MRSVFIFSSFSLISAAKIRKTAKTYKGEIASPSPAHPPQPQPQPRPPTATLTPTPTAPASPGICELRPVPPARTPKTPATNTENSGPRTPKLRLRLVARKEGFGNPKPSLHRTAPKPSLSISKSPIRGTRAEYLRRPPSRPHRPHWDPWRASAGSSNGRSGYPYPATRVRRPERPKRPHCRSAG